MPTLSDKEEMQSRTPLPSVEFLRLRYDYDPVAGTLVLKRGTKMRAAGVEVGHVTPSGYRRLIIDGTRYMAHRIIWKMMTDDEPPEFIDHVDGNRLNNTWVNLRAADAATNARNVSRHTRNKLQVKGVSVCKTTGRYAAFIRVEGKNRFLGRFSTVESASAAYVAATKSAFGDFMRLERSP